MVTHSPQEGQTTSALSCARPSPSGKSSSIRSGLPFPPARAIFLLHQRLGVQGHVEPMMPVGIDLDLAGPQHFKSDRTVRARPS